jgi:phage-related protein (TIGR01555 family)
LSKRNKRRQVQDTTPTPAAKEMPKPKMPRGLSMDAFSNVVARLGHGTPNLMEGTEYPTTRLTQNYQLMNSLYRSHWIVRRIIDTIPEDMTRNWITLTTQLPPEDVRRLDKIWRTRNVKSKILQGLKWGRLYGGAVGLILIEGHEDILDKPLDFDMVMPGTFKGLMIVDRWSGVYPNMKLIDNINDVDFGLPESYEVTTENAETLNVHHSRIVRFTGRELPHWERVAEIYWGASEVEVVFDELKKRDNTSWNIAQLIFLANLRVLKMGDLGQDLAVQDEKVQADLYNTLQAQNWLMSNMGMYILGKDDDFATHQYSFAGLNDIYESFMMDVAGACQIPVTKLFGRAPAGMNSTGESDMQNYYETVQQGQETILAPILDKLLPIMCMSEFGAIPDDMDYNFNPIRTPDDKDVADLVDKKTTSINTVFLSGLISQKIAMKELKQLGESTGMFTNITDEDIEMADGNIDQGDVPPEDGEEYDGSLGPEKTDRKNLQKRDPEGDAKPRGIFDWIKRSR